MQLLESGVGVLAFLAGVGVELFYNRLQSPEYYEINFNITQTRHSPFLDTKLYLIKWEAIEVGC